MAPDLPTKPAKAHEDFSTDAFAQGLLFASRPTQPRRRPSPPHRQEIQPDRPGLGQKGEFTWRRDTMRVSFRLVKTVVYKGETLAGIKSCCLEQVKIPQAIPNTPAMNLVPDMLLTVSFDQGPDRRFRGKDAVALEAKINAPKTKSTF